jgi:DNA-binding IclR family transcriptional regulator
VSDEISLAVPVRTGDRVLACLTVRFSASAVPMKTAQERFLPRLAAAAARIRDEFDRQHAGSNRS